MEEIAIFRRTYKNDLFEENSWIIAIGVSDKVALSNDTEIETINTLIEESKVPVFCALQYDFGLPFLEENLDEKKEETALFWKAKSVYSLKGNSIKHHFGVDSIQTREYISSLFEKSKEVKKLQWKALVSKENYLSDLEKVKFHLQRGNIYELNYCQEFNAKATKNWTSLHLFIEESKKNPTPFASYISNELFEMACFSPERFLQKNGNSLLSQPIKGTAKRGKTEATDVLMKNELLDSEKERAENVMIVDLVRNDLSKIAIKKTVEVDELFGIYSFPAVHQMISTISCKLDEKTTFTDILKATFPMGSMTGAPKKSAVSIANKLERTERNWYSGSVGIIEPNGDFDLNVVIRSLILDKKTQIVKCSVGGAITLLSDNEEEYEECRSKVGSLLSKSGNIEW